MSFALCSQSDQLRSIAGIARILKPLTHSYVAAGRLVPNCASRWFRSLEPFTFTGQGDAPLQPDPGAYITAPFSRPLAGSRRSWHWLPPGFAIQSPSPSSDVTAEQMTSSCFSQACPVTTPSPPSIDPGIATSHQSGCFAAPEKPA